MRKFFTLAFVAIMVVATSCELLQTETPTPAKKEQSITLTSTSLIEAPAEGGVYIITYTTEGEEARVNATTDNPDMIDTITSNGNGIVRINVTENPNTEVREAYVYITFGSSSTSVKVVQAAAEIQSLPVINVAANQLVGNYYGEKFGVGVGHYWIILTKDGFVNGSTVAGGEYFRLDVLAPVTDEKENIKLPDGDYSFDPAFLASNFTIIDINNTDYTWVDNEMNGWGKRFVDASLSVKGNELKLVAVTEDAEYRVSFNGDYSLSAPYEVTEHISSLTQDTVVDVSNCTASYGKYGDYWNCGFPNWNIEFVCNDGIYQGTYLVIDFLTASQSDFTGTFESSGFCVDDPTKPDFRAGVFVPGFRLDPNSNQMLGSLFMVYKNGICISQAPLYDGTITITRLSQGNYNIVLDCYDDAPKPNKITLNWTGQL
jgi:hypothetical protein